MCWGGVHVEAIGHHWIFSLITFYGFVVDDFETRALTEPGE